MELADPRGRHRLKSGTRSATSRGRAAGRPAASGDVAQKVRDAALAKVSGGTIERVETDADHGSPYEAHVRRTDGTELEVLVNKDFAVTAVNTMQHP